MDIREDNMMNKKELLDHHLAYPPLIPIQIVNQQLRLAAVYCYVDIFIN